MFEKLAKSAGSLIDNLATSELEIAGNIAKKQFTEYTQAYASGIKTAGLSADKLEALKVLKTDPTKMFNSGSIKPYQSVKKYFGDVLENDATKAYQGFLNESGGFDTGSFILDSMMENSSAGAYKSFSGQWADASVKEKVKLAGQAADSYLFGGTNTNQKAIRMGAAAMGVASAGRLLSGGGLTTTSSGEKDIIGIPFI